MTGSALDGIRVLEIGHGIAGPYATRLLADLGAEVIKLERPGVGDFTRQSGPALDAAGQSGVLFEALNWNKASVELDLGLPETREQFESLLAGVDIVITSLKPARLAEWRLLPADLLDVNPQLTVVAVTNFGLTGPQANDAATDLILNAASGIMAMSGSQDREPLKHGRQTAFFAAGLTAAYAALAGFVSVEGSRTGTSIDLAIRDCLTSELVMNNAFHSFCHLIQARPPTSSDPLDGHPLPTKNGYLSLQTSARIPVARFVELFDDADFADSRLEDAHYRITHAEVVRGLLSRHLEQFPAAELFADTSRRGFLSGFVQGVDELLDCPQLSERQVLRTLESTSTVGRPWKLPSSVVTLSESPEQVHRSAPALGQDNHLLAALPEPPRRDRRHDQVGQLVNESRMSKSGPLTGLRVVDLSTVFAVPYIGALLADFGAEVIKIESPVRLDQTRTDWGGYLDNDPGDQPWNRGATFQVVNRGKKSVSINLATEQGQEMLRQLVGSVDILLENFTPRVMKSWRASYSDLAAINPRLVMLSNTGYGATGPWSSFKAQGTTLEATMGLMGVTGYEGGPPMRAGQSTPDFYAAWAGLMAVFASLIARDRTGRGQHIDLAMYQIGASMLTDALIEYQSTGVVPQRMGATDVEAMVSGLFPTREFDGWLAVSLTGDQVGLLFEAIGSNVSAFPNGSGPDADSVAMLVRSWAAQCTARDAAHRLQQYGIAASKVMNAEDLANDVQLKHRGFYERVFIRALDQERPVIGRPFVWGSQATEVSIRSDAPNYGENNDWMQALLGLSAEEREQLREGGVMIDSPTGLPPAKALDVDELVAAGTFRRLLTDEGASMPS